MSNEHQHYLEKANACQKMAASAKTEEERISWLKLSASWLCLMRWGSTGQERAFIAELAATSTGQVDSTATH